MKQSKMKKIYNSKIFWMIISLLASLVLWAYVSNQSSTTITKYLTGVAVQFSGENTLRDEHDLAVSNVDNTSVNITIRGSRRAIGSLDASQVTALIDVSKITQAGAMSYSYSIRYPTGLDTSGISVVSRSPETIRFTVSALATKTVEVRGSFDGSMADGYSAEAPTFDPTTITITGSQAALQNVSYAWVSFEKTDVRESFSVDTGFKLKDKYGNECSSSGLTFSTDVIKATLPVKETRDVPLGVELLSGSGATESDCTVSIIPATIKLAGDSKDLDKLTKLIIGTIDLSDFATTYEKTLPITVGDNMDNVTGVTEATVKITVNGLSTKTFQVSSISCTNIAAGHTATPITQQLTVTLRGTADALEAITADKIRVIADLSGYKDATGMVMPEARVYVEGSVSVGAVGSYKISVEITKG